jgi:1-deoxy-D-xylulose-5-phosphate reductoisomerase
VKTLVVLGATGSIGKSTLDIVRRHPDLYRVVAMAAGRDSEGLAALAREFRPAFVALGDPASASDLKDRLSGTSVACGAGEGAVVEAALHPADLVIGAIVGTAGVRPTYAALSVGRQLALANKECLVCAGEAFMAAAALAGTEVLPLDSEHNAIHQAMGRHRPAEIDRMTLTASGGPFRTWTAERIAAATRVEALAHPNWDMGAKVTIDSASLMNKGLELIEARHLFDVPADRLDVLVHPQSIVHGMVSFADGSVTAGLAIPDMRVPIAHCLGYPERIVSGARALNLADVARLEFEKPDLARFPALRLAREALSAGGMMPAVLNAANEIAVSDFLAGRCSFGAIPIAVERVMDRFARAADPGETIEARLSLDAEVRRVAIEMRGGVSA